MRWVTSKSGPHTLKKGSGETRTGIGKAVAETVALKEKNRNKKCRTLQIMIMAVGRLRYHATKLVRQVIETKRVRNSNRRSRALGNACSAGRAASSSEPCYVTQRPTVRCGALSFGPFPRLQQGPLTLQDQTEIPSTARERIATCSAQATKCLSMQLFSKGNATSELHVISFYKHLCSIKPKHIYSQTCFWNSADESTHEKGTLSSLYTSRPQKSAAGLDGSLMITDYYFKC